MQGIEFLLYLHNAERSARGLPPMRLDQTLIDACHYHSRDLAASRRLSHRGADGSDHATRARRLGWSGRIIAENVAWFTWTPSGSQMVGTWMASPPHRSAILGPFEEFGISGASGARGDYYLTALYSA